MIAFTVQRQIAGAPAAVFDWLVDSSNYTSAPLVLREQRTRDGEQAPYGRGAVREITAIGAWFREEITLYERPREFRYLILKSLPGIDHHGGAIVFEEHEGGTRATWSTSYDVPAAWGGQPMARLLEPVLRWSFTTILRGAERSFAGPTGDGAARNGRGAAPSQSAHAPFALLNRLVNPLLRSILSSPLHPLLSGRIALITFTGRRSGRSYTIPVLYELEGDVVRIPVEWPARKRWWRNLRESAPVHMRLAGRERGGEALAAEANGRVSVEVRLDAGV